MLRVRVRVWHFTWPPLTGRGILRAAGGTECVNRKLEWLVSKGWVTDNSTGKQLISGVVGPFPVDSPVTKPFDCWGQLAACKFWGLAIAPRKKKARESHPIAL